MCFPLSPLFRGNSPNGAPLFPTEERASFSVGEFRLFSPLAKKGLRG
jgi:hypothetical protein